MFIFSIFCYDSAGPVAHEKILQPRDHGFHFLHWEFWGFVDFAIYLSGCYLFEGISIVNGFSNDI